MLTTTNLPSGYHRDLQLMKEVIVPAIQELKACIEMTVFTLKDIQINSKILEDPKYDYLFSVDTLNEFVLNGMPFRDAYKKMGVDIADGNFKPKKDIEHVHEGSIGNLCLDEIQKKFNIAFKE